MIRKIVVLAGVTGALIAGGTYAGLLSPGTSLPEELHGRWTTASPKYADRSFVLTDSTVAFHRGDAGPVVHRIRRVVRDDKEGEALFTIHYEDAGEDATFAFFHEPDLENASGPGTLRFPNQREMSWRREY